MGNQNINVFLLNQDLFVPENTVEPDQLVSDEAI